MAQPAADAAQGGDAANFYARALNDAQAGKYRITRRAANPVGRAGQKKVIRKRADGATCKIRPSAAKNETESASVSSTASATYAASTASEWWATSVSRSVRHSPAWLIFYIALDCSRFECREQCRCLVIIQLGLGRAIGVLVGTRFIICPEAFLGLRRSSCRHERYHSLLRPGNRHQPGDEQRLAGHDGRHMWPV